MKLSQLNGTLIGEDISVNYLSFDSKKISANALYFCLRGKQDGHDFAYEAIENGARAIVAEKRLDVDVPQLIVADSRVALSEISAFFYKNPEKKLKMIAITGTNGKTTTSYILASILRESGAKVGIIGTNGAFFDNKRIEIGLTTPDPPQLFYILSQMQKSGVEYVIMEVSAHAIYLNKVLGIVFEVAALTNLSQDHLDYFKDINEYSSAKSKLFTPLYCKCAVLNIDDKFGEELNENVLVKTLTYGSMNPSDVFAIDLKMSVNGLEYILNLMDDMAKIKFSMTGRFNMYNSLCASAIAKALKIGVKEIAEGIRKLKKVDGRYNIINTTKCSVIIDFAHTEDGLKNIISSIREYAPKRIITVFGCGGDRDKSKRALMGKTASNLSDLCVITSDNPRGEEPESIIREIISGVEKDKNYVSMADRKQAIKYALETASDGDIILIAGKGAEKYQEIKGVRYEYNDGDYILKLIEERKI